MERSEKEVLERLDKKLDQLGKSSEEKEEFRESFDVATAASEVSTKFSNNKAYICTDIMKEVQEGSWGVPIFEILSSEQAVQKLWPDERD